jgi:hypothetical protein
MITTLGRWGAAAQMRPPASETHADVDKRKNSRRFMPQAPFQLGVPQKTGRPMYHRDDCLISFSASGICPFLGPTLQSTSTNFQSRLVLISAGTFSNVIRFLIPLVIDDPTLQQGLDILESSLRALQAGDAGCRAEDLK